MPGKIAPEADRYAPFLSIGKVSTERVSHEPITRRPLRMSEIGSTKALDLSVHLLFLPLSS